jgi:hypothetical protein
MNRENREKPTLDISLDYGAFEQQDYEALESSLEPHFRVGGGRTIELSEVDVAHAVVRSFKR